MATSVASMTWTPTPTDGLSGETLRAQLETEHATSSALTEHMQSLASPLLQKGTHLNWLAGLIQHPLPQGYTSLDASRPWILYWVLHSFALLGGELDKPGKARVVDLLLACQSEQGGFGGGPGQLSHLAPTYAAVCALAYAGEEGWDKVDRPKMYKFLLSLKQADGSFIMHKGGEVDVRGTYCALSVATILNLLTPTLAATTPAFVASCQTYEGGLASAAQTFPSSHSSPSAALGEAHGGYAFCAIASWAMLRVFSDKHSPAYAAGQTAQAAAGGAKGKEVDLKALRRWAVAMQAMPIEGGGFRGRSNKLVDGCYSWWGGGIFGVLGALLDEGKERDEAPEEIYSREGLQEYILLCAQAPSGGLRDKPGKHPDAYHTCYNLSGLAAAQHALYRPHSAVAAKKAAFVDPFDPESFAVELDLVLDEAIGETEAQAVVRMREVWASVVGWKEGEEKVVGGEENKLNATNPVVNVVQESLVKMMGRFYRQKVQIELA